MKKTISALVLPLILTACTATSPENISEETNFAPVAECTFFGKPELQAPTWICDPNTDDKTYISQAMGFSENAAGGLAHQKNLAILQAKKELADQIKSEIITKVKSKTGTIGVAGAGGATAATLAEMETIANVELNGVKIIKSLKGPDGYFYVHTGLPYEVLKQNVEKVVEGLEQAQVIPQSTKKTNKMLSEEIAKAFAEG